MVAIVSMTLPTKLTHMFSLLPSSTPQQLSRISLISDSVETLLHYQIRNTHSFPQTKHSIHQFHLARKLKNWRKRFLVGCRTFFWELWYSLLSLLVAVSGGVAAGGKIGSVAEERRKTFPATTQEYLFQEQGTSLTSRWKIVLWRTILLRTQYLPTKESMVKVGRDIMSITKHFAINLLEIFDNLSWERTNYLLLLAFSLSLSVAVSLIMW